MALVGLEWAAWLHLGPDTFSEAWKLEFQGVVSGPNVDLNESNQQFSFFFFSFLNNVKLP